MCGFGNVHGIHGAKCRHSHGPGDGKHNPFQEFDSEENRKKYEQEQRQRTLERRIRDTKRQVMGWKTAMDAEDDPAKKAELESKYQRKAALLQRQNAAYNEFCKTTGQKKRSDRISIARWDRSQAAQARAAAKKYQNDLEKRRNFVKMEEEIRTVAGLAKNAKIHIPPEQIFARGLSFDEKHINVERKHNVSNEMAIRWIEDSKVSITVWNGKFERYYGTNGAAYVEWEEMKIRTAFS